MYPSQLRARPEGQASWSKVNAKKEGHVGNTDQSYSISLAESFHRMSLCEKPSQNLSYLLLCQLLHTNEVAVAVGSPGSLLQFQITLPALAVLPCPSAAVRITLALLTTSRNSSCRSFTKASFHPESRRGSSEFTSHGCSRHPKLKRPLPASLQSMRHFQC